MTNIGVTQGIYLKATTFIGEYLSVSSLFSGNTLCRWFNLFVLGLLLLAMISIQSEIKTRSHASAELIKSYLRQDLTPCVPPTHYIIGHSSQNQLIWVYPILIHCECTKTSIISTKSSLISTTDICEYHDPRNSGNLHKRDASQFPLIKSNSNILSKYNHIHLYILFNGPNATLMYQIKQKQFLIPYGFQPFERHRKHPKPPIKR